LEVLIVISRLRPCLGLLVIALISSSACNSKSPTAPTPAPAPAPAPPPPPPPTPPPPPAPAALESITLSESTVPSQAQPTATIRLTAAAPAGNAPVALESSNPAVAKVPANVSVAAGETTNSFTIDTSTVRESTDVTISARYEGVTKTAILTVVPPSLQPRFKVTSPTRGEDVCVITSAAGAVDCTLDASASSGFVAVYRWTLTVAGKDLTVNMPEGSAAFVPATTCALLSGGSVNSDGVVPMVIVLRLEDRQGNVTSPVQRTVAIVPNGMCGY
jgi:hypothetical protein